MKVGRGNSRDQIVGHAAEGEMERGKAVAVGGVNLGIVPQKTNE